MNECVSDLIAFGSVLRMLQVLRSLVLVYMSPETADNQELRQCLTYFFPVYSYSSSLNQTRMQKVCLEVLIWNLHSDMTVFQIFVSVFTQLCQVQKDWEEDEDVVTPAQAGLLFVDWTDPLKASYAILIRHSVVWY